jgi:hypothetical protein
MDRHDSVISAVRHAAAAGVTATDLKKLPGAAEQIKKLKADGIVRGPMRIGRSDRYFASEHAPTRDQIAGRVEELLRDAGLKLTSLSKLESIAKFAPKALFADTLSALKADGRVVEVRDARKSKLYLHREPLLEQLRPETPGPESRPEPGERPGISLDEVRPVYEALKSQQGGISTVKISEVLRGINASKAALHHLLLDEAKKGRVTLHPATTVSFPPEVLEAGITLEGEPYPFVTFTIKERA